MKDKLKYLTWVSLKRKISTKWFLIVNILLCLAITCIVNIDSLIKFFGGDFNDKRVIYVVDNTGFFYDKFKVNFESLVSNIDDFSNFSVVADDRDISLLEDELKNENKNNLILVVNNDPNNLINCDVISNHYVELIDLQLITSSINNTKVELAIANSSIPVDVLNSIYDDVSINRVILESDKSLHDENITIVMNTIFPIFILPFFMLTIILIQMIGAEVNDEKSTRGMEIIISNVSPSVHFASKVIAGNLFVIGQTILLIIYCLLGLGIRKLIGGDSIVNGVIDQVMTSANDVIATGIGSQIMYILPVTILLMLITFISYSLLAGILASMTTNTEDFQQLQTPIIVVSLVGYYLAMMANVFKGSLFIKFIAYIPLISSILTPSLLILGQFNLFDVIISFLLVILFNYLLIKYGLKIYKVGILNYSSKDLWKKMFKALK